MNVVWHWRQEERAGLTRLQVFYALAPWLSAALAVAALLLVQDTLHVRSGTDFELPAGMAQQSDVTGPLAVLLPEPAEAGGTPGTLVFFDDVRYVLAAEASRQELSVRLAARVSASKAEGLTLLVDRRVPTGDVLQITALARQAGIRKIRLAGKDE